MLRLAWRTWKHASTSPSRARPPHCVAAEPVGAPVPRKFQYGLGTGRSMRLIFAPCAPQPSISPRRVSRVSRGRWRSHGRVPSTPTKAKSQTLHRPALLGCNCVPRRTTDWVGETDGCGQGPSGEHPPAAGIATRCRPFYEDGRLRGARFLWSGWWVQRRGKVIFSITGYSIGAPLLDNTRSLALAPKEKTRSAWAVRVFSRGPVR